MGFDDWMDLNNDGDVSGGEAFLGLSSAGALGFAVGADEAQYVAYEKSKADRKKYERLYRDLEDERDELLEENKRLKKKHRSSYWDDDDDDDWDDEDDDDDDDDDFDWDDEDDDDDNDDDDDLDWEEQKAALEAEKAEFEMQRLKEEAAYYKRIADENDEQIKVLRAEIAELKRKLTED